MHHPQQPPQRPKSRYLRPRRLLKTVLKSEGNSWRAWCALNVNRSYRDIKQVMSLAHAPDPAAAVEKEREAARTRMTAKRAKETNVRPSAEPAEPDIIERQSELELAPTVPSLESRSGAAGTLRPKNARRDTNETGQDGLAQYAITRESRTILSLLFSDILKMDSTLWLASVYERNASSAIAGRLIRLAEPALTIRASKTYCQIL
jgi:hypothetical protein